MRVSAVLLVLTASVAAYADPTYANPDLRPFTSVPSDCDTCSTGPHFDKIVLRSGTTIKAYVAAQNPDFYFLVRFGEFRAVGRPRVASIDPNREPDKLPAYPDQILFTDGSVLGGTLQSSPTATDSFAIQVPPENQIHFGTYNVVQEVFHDGKLVYSAPPKKK